MDFNILRQVLQNELLDMKINHYDKGTSGTLGLAEKYLSNLEYCSSKRVEKASIEMIYRNKPFGFLHGQSPSTNTTKAIRTANNKLKTEKILADGNINTTRSTIFEMEEYEKAKSMVNESKHLMVIKPYNLNAGRGITLNVDPTNFDFAWKQALKAYEKTTQKFKVLIQPMLPGIETRMLIVEGHFNSAILRVPSNIIGDGKLSIKELIDEKNNIRRVNPHLKLLPIKISETLEYNLELNGNNLHTVPEKNELIFLHFSSNISLGGDSYEVSHLINDSMKKLAEKSVAAISGLSTAGVDILFRSFHDEEPAVLEINPGANLRMHHYPWKGTPKSPVHDLIDSMLSSYKSGLK
ncbi:ATP-grasp domain-containing protein [Salinicoccus cyprini]|uniref:ATP-grasp domain-containing protein n=1 Tax=Salinicoccus cyprini TaxID=2493691 RepID=A0A558AX99_9STAP|nr:ATP-grasp domain-containing protein [Salinicoccus cyprini]TVT28886.1 ATP-grasp domain-containing protein [Salinicoccus cyprini]